MKNRIYCQVWGALVPAIESVPAVEWKITFIAKFGVPLFPQSRAHLWQIMFLWQFGLQTVCTSHIGSMGPRAIWYIAHIPALMWNQNRVYGLVWDISLRDWKPLWETSTCVGWLISPEGYVSSLNKCNPIQSLQFIQDRWIEKYS